MMMMMMIMISTNDLFETVHPVSVPLTRKYMNWGRVGAEYRLWIPTHTATHLYIATANKILQFHI